MASNLTSVSFVFQNELQTPGGGLPLHLSKWPSSGKRISLRICGYILGH